MKKKRGKKLHPGREARRGEYLNLFLNNHNRSQTMAFCANAGRSFLAQVDRGIFA
jgi:hypothetical protein